MWNMRTDLFESSHMLVKKSARKNIKRSFSVVNENLCWRKGRLKTDSRRGCRWELKPYDHEGPG